MACILCRKNQLAKPPNIVYTGNSEELVCISPVKVASQPVALFFWDVLEVSGIRQPSWEKNQLEMHTA
jgi:hypothetical protein